MNPIPPFWGDYALGLSAPAAHFVALAALLALASFAAGRVLRHLQAGGAATRSLVARDSGATPTELEKFAADAGGTEDTSDTAPDGCGHEESVVADISEIADAVAIAAEIGGYGAGHKADHDVDHDAERANAYYM